MEVFPIDQGYPVLPMVDSLRQQESGKTASHDYKMFQFFVGCMFVCSHVCADLGRKDSKKFLLFLYKTVGRKKCSLTGAEKKKLIKISPPCDDFLLFAYICLIIMIRVE